MSILFLIAHAGHKVCKELVRNPLSTFENCHESCIT